MSQTIDIYDSLTNDELQTVTNIFLEALSRRRLQPPEVFEIVTNIIIDSIIHPKISSKTYKMSQEVYKQLCNPTPVIKYYFLTNWQPRKKTT